MSTEYKYDNRRKNNSYSKYSKGKKNYGGSYYKPSQGRGESDSFKSGKSAKNFKNYRKKPYQKQSRPVKNKPSVKIAFLGGLNEIGKNITRVECENDIIIVDIILIRQTVYIDKCTSFVIRFDIEDILNCTPFRCL